MGSIILAIFLVILSFFLVSTPQKDKYIYLLHFLLLLLTPWLIILILGRPPLKPQVPNKVICNQISSNASCLISPEFLFFQADSRKLYGIKDHGVFLPSLIPALIVGLLVTLTSNGKKRLSTPIAMVVGLVLTISMSKDGGLLTLLWLVVPISAVATLGFHKMLSLLLSKQAGLLIKTLVLMNIGLLAYESLRLYQIIIFHKPFS